MKEEGIEPINLAAHQSYYDDAGTGRNLGEVGIRAYIPCRNDLGSARENGILLRSQAEVLTCPAGKLEHLFSGVENWHKMARAGYRGLEKVTIRQEDGQ
ncbi:MAG TPA: hypothetical protein GXX40_02315 [Firmicutes bacterium]|nr:hypothetical protein [Bacillota bacterium]